MKSLFGVTLGILTAIGGFLDAGTISTSGEAGATFGLGLVWTVIVGTVAVVLLVEMSGRLAAVSQHTYAEAIRDRFGFPFFLLPLVTELIAESILLAAQIGGVAIAVSLFTGVDWHVLFPFAALFLWCLVWRAPFGVIENGPALLGLVTLSFIAGIVSLGGPDHELVTTLWRPQVESGEPADYFFLVAAILGATVSPYLVYFYSSGAKEESWTEESLSLNRITAVVGMGFGCIGSIAVICLTAMVLKPLNMGAGTLQELGLGMAEPYGKVGSWLFAIVLFATCLGAALEVLLSLGYMTAQGLGWEWGEHKKPAEAPRFNLALLVILLVAVLVGLTGLDPLQLAIYGSALIALVLPFSLAPFLIIMNDPRYLGDRTNHRAANLATVAIILVASVVALVSIPLLILSGGG
ncbi:MAG: NRAMP family divalent metal transporter [Thermomicrobiales bacterium]